MAEQLSNLIIKRILANIGAVPSPPGVGLLESSLLLNNSFKVQYDTGPVGHDMYAGKIVLDPMDGVGIQGLVINLSVDDIPEFLFVFRMGNLPIHAAKALYDEADLGETFLKIYNDEKGTWTEASMYMKARLLAEYERLTSHGYLWEDIESHKDLLQAAVNLINLQKG